MKETLIASLLQHKMTNNLQHHFVNDSEYAFLQSTKNDKISIIIKYPY